MKSKLSKIVMLVFLVANLGMAEYVKRDNAVYYKAETEQVDERKVDDADSKTFVELNKIYGKDSKNVFYEDKKLGNADLKTFQIIGEVTGKDKKYIYNYDEKLEVNAKDFKLYKNKDELLYFRNNDKLYIGGSFLEVEYVQDLDSFEAIDEEYSKDKYNIYYAGTPIYDVGKSTFQIIMPDYYAKDKNNVYSGSDKIKDANPDTIKILNQVYLKDDKNVFLNFGQKIKNADASTFEVMEENTSYGKDKNNVYFLGEKIKGADAKSFEIILEPNNLVQMYSKDRNSVFIGGRKIKEADLKTFERLSVTDYYLKDKNNLYYQEVKIDKIDNKNLKILYSDGVDVVKNGNKIFAEGKKLNIKSPETFEIILSKYYNVPNLIYGKDDKNVYVISKSTKFDETYSTKIIKNADVNSFEVMKNSMYTKDKNNIYFTRDNTVKLKGADKGSFVIVTEEVDFSYDKNNVYFRGKKINGINSDGFKIINLNNPNESFYFLADNKNLYKFITIFSEDTDEIVETKLVPVKNPKVDITSFESVKKFFTNYYRDKSNIYYYDADYKALKRLEGADRNSFISFEANFGKDNKNVFYNGNKLEGVNSDGFEILDENTIIFKNKSNVYFLKAKNEEKKYKLIPLNFDSSSFKPVHKRSEYFKDKNGIYYFDYSNLEKLDTEKTEDIQNKLFFKIEGVDVPTFRELQFGYSKDRNRVYCKNKEVKDADAESFVIFYTDDRIVVKDKNRIYENGCE